MFIAIASIIFLLGTFFLTAVSTSLRVFRRHMSKKQLYEIKYNFLYCKLLGLVFKKSNFERLFFSMLWSKNSMRFCYACCSTILILSYRNSFSTLITFFSFLTAFLLFLIIGDLIPRSWGIKRPQTVLKLCGPISSMFLFLTSPISLICLKLYKSISEETFLEQVKSSRSEIRDKIIEILQQNRTSNYIDPEEEKLISSIITFKDKIVREIMVPRIKIFSINTKMSMAKALKSMAENGYSRVPVYQENIDNIIGILMYKDLSNTYIENQTKNIDIPLENIVNKALYTPETKKISSLLKEFRNRQVHFAVVVDEYGGTAGIVTIEDILEELVGEIEDEYDEQPGNIFTFQTDGGMIVDGSISILEIEEKLKLPLEKSGDYDTLGGYIFHCAGAIPKKGFTIQHNDFSIEVLKSNDRTIEKVRITKH